VYIGDRVIGRFRSDFIVLNRALEYVLALEILAKAFITAFLDLRQQAGV